MKNKIFALVILAACLTACKTGGLPPRMQEMSAATEAAEAAEKAKKKESPQTDISSLRLRGGPEAIVAQGKRNVEIVEAVMATAVAHAKGANHHLPEWVAIQYAGFEAKEYTKDKAAFQRSFGWGKGIYQGKSFFWFAYTNTEGYLQFGLSAKLDEKSRDVAATHKDGYGHRWSVVDPVKGGFYLPNTETWLGITKLWPDKFCTKPDTRHCDTGGVLDQTVAEMNSALHLGLVVKGKFPWEYATELDLPPLPNRRKD